MGPTANEALVKTPLPDHPEPFLLVTASISEGVATSTNLELTIVRFEPVSNIKTTGLQLILASTNIKPKAWLERSGISAEFGGCGETPNPNVTAKSMATAYRRAVRKATFRLTSPHSRLWAVPESPLGELKKISKIAPKTWEMVMSNETGRRGGSKDIPGALSAPRDTTNADTLELYEFGPFQLDAKARKLMRGGEAVALTPKVFDTLYLLVRNSGHLLERDQLIRQLWPDSIPSIT